MELNFDVKDFTEESPMNRPPINLKIVQPLSGETFNVC